MIAIKYCEKPACAKACPADAISKREEDGIVVINRDTCLGNSACDELCKKACPYSIPQFGEDTGGIEQIRNISSTHKDFTLTIVTVLPSFTNQLYLTQNYHIAKQWTANLYELQE